MKTSNGMKLLLAAALYPPETRGPATFAGQLVEHLTEGKASVEVVKFSDVRRFPPVLRHVVYFFKLCMRGRGSDVVLALDPVSTGLPALFAAKLLRARFVLRIGGDYSWEQGVRRFGVEDLLDEFVAKNKTAYPRLVEFLWDLQCSVARRADVIVVPSEYLRGIVRQWLISSGVESGVADKRIRVVHSSVEPAPASLNKNDTRKRVGWGEEPIVFSIGQLVPWKGYPALIAAAGALRREFPDLRLIIAGGGDQRALRALAAERGFDPDTVFVGELPNVILRDLMSGADVFALNTAYEGLSHAILEAMQGGIPVVTTPVGGNTDLIEDGTTGLLVPFNDAEKLAAAIRDLLKHRAKAAALARAARAKAAAFTSADSMRAWEKLLKTVSK